MVGMKEYPMTFNEFTTRFSTEQDCAEYLYQLRWGDGFVCPKCGNDDYWSVNGKLFTCKSCRHQASVLAGTIFQDTRKPLKDWFVAIWWITTQKYGASAEGLQRILGIKSYQTAWTWLHKIRTAMVLPGRSLLSGRVEIDETYIGSEDSGGKSGRGSGNKALVVIAAETSNKKLGRIRLGVVDDASAQSLHGFIEASIAKGSTLVTDAWSGYNGIEKKNYVREIYNQSKAETPDELLPHVHTFASLLKRWLLGTHQGGVQEKHLQAYLDEYVFRFNRRTSKDRGLLFYRLIENAMQTPPTTYYDFVHKPKTEET